MDELLLLLLEEGALERLLELALLLLLDVGVLVRLLEDEPLLRLTVDWVPLGETVLILVLVVPELLTRL